MRNQDPRVPRGNSRQLCRHKVQGSETIHWLCHGLQFFGLNFELALVHFCIRLRAVKPWLPGGALQAQNGWDADVQETQLDGPLFHCLLQP